jgi:hypothetical protein
MLKDEIIQELERFKKYVLSQSRANLTRGGKNVSKKLYNSIKGETFASKKASSIGLYFEMEDHGSYQDQGVKGKTSSNRAPNSPYKFGTGTGPEGGLTQGIKAWVKAKRIQFKSKEEGAKGRFLSYDQTARLITRAIYNKGLKPSYFFTKPFNNAFERLPNDIVDRYGLVIDELLKQQLK